MHDNVTLLVALFFALVAVIALSALGRARGTVARMRSELAGVPGALRQARKNAVARSEAVRRGQVSEQLAPFAESFGYDPGDARFLGSPVDFVVFDGLSEGRVRDIVFVEVKTGRSQLSRREKSVRQAAERGAVSWREFRMQ